MGKVGLRSFDLRQAVRATEIRSKGVHLTKCRLGDGALLLYSKESLNREVAARPPRFLPGRTAPREQLV